MYTEVINNISEYLKIIHQTKFANHIWYRGQRYSEYMLEPSLFRDKKEVITGDKFIQFRSYKFKDEDSALKTFKKEITKIMNTKDFDEIHYLYLMQHYDIQTRLLDFSTNPLIALYFSVNQENEIHKDAEQQYFEYKCGMFDYNKESSAIFCINPKLVNKYTLNKEEIIDLSSYKFSTLKNLDFPVCIKPRNEKIDIRLSAQSGVFVYFGTEVNPLDFYSIQNDNILKIIIPNSKREGIKKELKKRFKIYNSTVFPDMKGVTLEIAEIMNKKYK